ncbi:adenosylcobinamide-GDP ribazoletransferase [Methylocystis echinoides]|uniref:Adenosylcobinamide-GDP ribazoletransferase n=1 Tax=Methylocystis echinoides TaxID=29468 RepID=A0A9W6GVE2_9HYPH|nr:adenosylcobinamide-GDP ribazoletransferase [Methylocystis echinoides]GLI93734.1 adenosylcobinamide-GDP ribazoletransferase [Methylocystis echinoides]
MQTDVLADIRACLRFYTRLPIGVGRDGHAMPDFSRLCWATPIAGACVGALGAAALWLSASFGLPAMVAATATVCVQALVTGALHEDGLADVADGFGGGHGREQKLAIMRDSRVGTFGVLALCLSTLLRVCALAAIMQKSVPLAVFALLGAAALSRAAGLLPLTQLRPARSDGAGSAAATPAPSAMRAALLIGVVLALAPALGAASLAQAVIGVMACFAAVMGVTELARRQIGGYTGDVLGAAQQSAEIALLVVWSAN